MYIDFNKKNNKESPKFEAGFEYQNVKIFLRKAMFQIGLKMFLWLKKFKNTVPWAYVTSNLKGGEIVPAFYEKELQKAN